MPDMLRPAVADQTARRPRPQAPMAVPQAVPPTPPVESMPQGNLPAIPAPTSIAPPTNVTPTIDRAAPLPLPPTGTGTPIPPQFPLPAIPPTTGTTGTVATTPTDPNNPLTNQTISVSPTVDRFKIAEDRYNAGEPQYQAALRSAQQKAFGAGRGVSGALRTSLGDAASAREGQRVNFLSDALTGTIDDAYKNVGIAQQQQGFQSGQQNTAFAQDLATKQLQEALTSGAFGRALQQAQFGYGNDPSQIALILSQIFGTQANAAGDAAAGLFGQQGKSAGSSNVGGLPQWAIDLLKKGSALPTSTQLPADAGSY